MSSTAHWASDYVALRLPAESVVWHIPIGSPVVYFLASTRLVKIGVTADLTRRLASLRGQNPEDLTLLAVLRGGYPLERHLHARFAPLRERGEWFRNSGDLAELLENLRETL